MLTLVCGVSTERPVALLIDALRRREADFVVLDQQRLVDTVRGRWSIGPDGLAGAVWVGDRAIDLAEIGGVYLRFMSAEHMPRGRGNPELVARTGAIVHELAELFDVLPARVVNRRRPMMSNDSKPYQALLIQQAGFRVPETLVTNDPGRVLELERRVGPLVYKSVSSERSIVATLDLGSPEDLARLEMLRHLPTQFQRKIEGSCVRVHVVGSRCFAAKIVSEGTDYRYAHREGKGSRIEEYELTDGLRHRCIRLARALDMSFVGIDLILGEDDVYCLEVNPSPAYSYYQDHTGVPIADALAEYLADGE